MGIEVNKIDISPYNDVGEMTREEFSIRKSQAMHVEEDTYMLTKAIMAIWLKTGFTYSLNYLFCLKRIHKWNWKNQNSER